ncbi:MAG: type II secretion system GspH family protein [Sulfurimonas sp.]|nr:type II secretion system GspH family protein [Sulfurimonas sp.]
MIKKIKKAFTMLELVFVIVIVGLLATFGVEFMVQSYKSYLFSKINNQLQNESATTVKFIAKRLSHRIKDSVIARDLGSSGFVSIQNIVSGSSYTVLEWVGVDIDGWRGNTLPFWSGIIDLEADLGQTTNLTSPETNTAAISGFIATLSGGSSSIADSALYFLGSDSDSSYGWGGPLTSQQTAAMHPVTTGTNTNQFSSSIGADFSGTVVSEYYKHAWTAYAIVHSNNGDLTLHYNYQPWAGETYDAIGIGVRTELIMQNVTTFQYKAIDTLIKIQVCVEHDLAGEEYAICKEKTIY